MPSGVVFFPLYSAQETKIPKLKAFL